jgi:hypothetical protein
MLWIVFGAGLLVGGIGGALAIVLCVASKTLVKRPAYRERRQEFASQSRPGCCGTRLQTDFITDRACVLIESLEIGGLSNPLTSLQGVCYERDDARAKEEYP